MARPIKHNADYFSHDADMRNDQKVNALRVRFGLEGYAVWNMILEVLTDKDCFKYPWDELGIELLASDFRIEPKRLIDIVEYGKRLGLISIEGEFLFSNNHRKRFEALFLKRDRDRDIKTNSPKHNDVIADEKKVIADEKKVIADENTDSKVEYSKQNNRIEYALDIADDFYPFEDFWNEYDKKRGRVKTEKKWKNISLTDRKLIKEFILLYKQAQPDKTYRKDPLSFLDNNSWLDEIIHNNNEKSTAINQTNGRISPRNDAADRRQSVANLKDLSSRILSDLAPKESD